MPTELELEQARLQRLRERGDPASLHRADRLDKAYHASQMDALAQDVYHVAAGEHDKPPPQGWTRLSEHSELMAKYAAELQMSPRKLLETLHPDRSGFRAEIYLPDAALQQAGFKPTLALKGSAGTVIGPDGQPRDTTAEDFGANNFPQSIGLETDYYDRAMSLGKELKDSRIDFESTGHSLAGGMAAAVAAVTGTHATTFNAAGLNPITTARFAQQNPGVVVSRDLNPLITNYQVQGELLGDGVQGNIHSMDVLRRQELGAMLKETCDVLQRVPEARALLTQQLGQGLPPYARESVDAFVAKLATGNTDRLLRDLPLGAGEQHVLAAMTRDPQGKLVPRMQVTSLPETMQLGAPVLESLAAMAAGAHVGERGGEVMAAGGHLEAQGLRVAGRGVNGAADQAGAWAQTATRLEGAVARMGEHAVGATLAHVRTAQAELSAQINQGLGQAERLDANLDAALLRGVSHVMPAHTQHELQAHAAQREHAGRAAEQRGAAAAAVDRQAGQVDAAAIRSATQAMETATQHGAEAYGAAQHALIGGAGHVAHGGLDAAANSVDGATRHAPAAFGAAGALAGLGAAAAWELNPSNYPRLLGAAEAVSQGRQAGAEAFERHLMKTVTPSLDAYRQSLERQADQSLQHTATQGHAAPVSPPAQAVTPTEQNVARSDPRHPDNPQHKLYETLERRIPEASQNRLLQFTAACHEQGITDKNIGRINLVGGEVQIQNRELGPPALIDIKTNPPSPQESIKQIQQADVTQAQVQAAIQQMNLQAQQGPTLGGGPR